MVRTIACLSILAVVTSFTQAQLVIDDFLDGNYHKTFTGPGNFTERVDNIDPLHTVGGSRQIMFTASGGSEVTLDSRDGQFAVDWQGIVTQRLDLIYGVGPTGIDLDLSWMTSFEVNRSSVPPNIYGTGYTIFLRDRNGNGVDNNSFRGRPGEAIGFNKIDFTGSPAFDWEHVSFIRFQQEHESVTSRIEGYRTFEIVAVPEPCGLTLLGAAGLLFARGRTKSKRSSI